MVARAWALRTKLYCFKLDESRLVSFLCLGGTKKNFNAVTGCLEGSYALQLHCGWLAGCKLRHNLKCSHPRFPKVKAPGHSSVIVIHKISSCLVLSSLCGSWDGSLSVRAACFFSVPRIWLQILYFWLLALNIFTAASQGFPFHHPSARHSSSLSYPTPALHILSSAALSHHPHLLCQSWMLICHALPQNLLHDFFHVTTGIQDKCCLKVNKADNFSYSQSVLVTS